MRRQIYYFLALLITFSVCAQIQPKVAKYDLPKKRLLLNLSAMYLYNANQGAIDQDSSFVLTSTAYNLPLLLPYTEGLGDDNLIGSDLIEKGDINAAQKLLNNSNGENHIKLLLQLGSFYLFKPIARPQDLQNAKLNIDKAVAASKKLKSKRWQHQSLLLLGRYYYQANDPAEGKKYLAQVIDECRKENDQKGLAQALEIQADVMFNLDPEKGKYLQEAVSLYTALGLEEKRIENEMKITTIYFWTGNAVEARKRFYEHLAELRKIGFAHQQFAETTISFIELNMHNIKSALYYALKSVKRMEAEKDYTFGDIFYTRLADVYNIIGHHEEALELYQKSIEIGRHSIDSGTWYKSFVGAVAALSMKGKNKEALSYINSVTKRYPPQTPYDKMFAAFIKANCYAELKNYTQAEKYFIETDHYAGQMNSPETFRDVAHQYTIMALFYAKTGKPQKVKYYADKVFAVNKASKKPYNSESFQILLYKNDSINGNFKEALYNFQNYKKISDSIRSSSNIKQIEELKIAYETKNKEQKINLLNRQSALQESELQKSKLLINVSIASLVLLLIIIALLYNRYRLKQRNHAKLEIKQREINQKNINLNHLLNEKEWLLKEVHHRVKNNLQTVISLLSSQSAYLDNDMALSAIKNSQHRIHSMSLIHQRLYNSDNIATINMPTYIKDLVEYLKDSFAIGQRIRFETTIAPLDLDVAQAIPIGLILNETITNAIKYAFPENRIGVVSVVLEKVDSESYMLVISDNGIGIDTKLSTGKTKSFGMTLIKGLTQDLEGKFSIENNNGTTLKIEFMPEEPLTKKYSKKPDLDSEV